MAGNSIFLSEAQLVVADPCAEIQQWHVDSATGRGCFQLATLWWHGFFIFPLECLDGTYTPTKTSKRKVNQFVLLVTACYQSCSRKSGGLSIFIPLQDIALDRGPQEVLPGTHSLHDAWLSAIRFRRTLKLTNFTRFLDNFRKPDLRILGITCVRGGEDVFEAFVQAMVELPSVSRVVFGPLEMPLSWILVLYIEAPWDGFLWWGILFHLPQMFHEFVDFWYKMIRCKLHDSFFTCSSLFLHDIQIIIKYYGFGDVLCIFPHQHISSQIFQAVVLRVRSRSWVPG